MRFAIELDFDIPDVDINVENAQKMGEALDPRGPMLLAFLTVLAMLFEKHHIAVEHLAVMAPELDANGERKTNPAAMGLN